ncbi:MAG: hypothetical protein QOG21_110 [Actinomycetota bacterium]|jgi:hypothetical protein|nr:hypothetical protein [Actinomycetota bacterium]
MDRTELEAMSSKELHESAVGHAVRHADLGFLWSLVKALPAAEAAAGNVRAAEGDVISVSALLSDVMSSDEGKLADALRPLYIDYLEKHDH